MAMANQALTVINHKDQEETIMKFNNVDFDTYLKNYPDKNGYFGRYGGCYIPAELQKAMEEITEAY